MNLILLAPDEVEGGHARIEGRRYRHIRSVLRSKPGDSLQVGVVGRGMGSATVVEVGDAFVDLTVDICQDPPPARPVVLALALPRPHTLGKVLQAVAAMGIKDIVLFHSARVEKSYWTSSAIQHDQLRRHLLLGLEQGCDTVVPQVTLRKRFRPFVEDDLPALVGAGQGLVAHMEAERPCPSAVAGAITLVVGPEGGFVEYEIDKLIHCGLEPVHLGRRPLRVEHVVPALLGRLL